MRKILFTGTGLLALLIFFTSCKSNNVGNKQYIFIGTYTDSVHTDGIYVYDFNEENGSLEKISNTENILNPSYLAFMKDKQYLYAVNENPDTVNTVSAFSFDSTKGTLHLSNQVPANGTAACFVTTDATGKNIIETNYGSGNFSVYKTDAEGKLLPAAQIVQHTGKSINQNQTQARAHSAFFSPDEKYLFVCDLGNDTLYQYPFNANADKPIDELNARKYKIDSGFGPRHLSFTPNGKFLYLLCELEAKVIGYAWNNDSLKYLQTVTSTNIPDTSNDDKGSAAIRVSPDGKFLYASNRGQTNDIAIFKINENGSLDSLNHFKVDRHPRDFNISPNGKFLLVASRDDNSVKVYNINKETGELTYSNQSISLPMPVCITFTKK